MIKIVEDSRHKPCSLFRCLELVYPAHVLGAECRRSVKSLSSSPKFAAKDIRQCEIVRVTDRPLAGFVRQFQSPAVKVRRFVQFET